MVFQQYQTGGEQLRGIFQSMQNFGFTDFVLPFLLIFTLVFAVFQKTELFRAHHKWDAGQKKYVPLAPGEQGPPDRRINSLLSLAIAGLIVLPHVVGMYPPGKDPILMIQGMLPSTAIVLAAVFVTLLLLGLAGADAGNAMKLAVAVVALAFLLFLFGMNIFPGWFPTFDFLRDPNIQAGIIVLLTMGLIGWWVIRPQTDTDAAKTLREWMTVRHPALPTPPAAGGRGGHP